MEITNNEERQQFEVSVDGGTGFLRYRVDNGSILLLYVEVPHQSQGRGVAAELSRTALEFAKQRGLKVVPVCSYVAAYVRRHPEYLVG